MNKHTLIPAAALAVALTACSSGSEDKDNTPRKATVTSSRAVTVSPAPTPTATGPLMYELADSARWGHLAAALDDFDRGRTSDAGVPENTRYIRADVTFTNRTDRPIDLTDLTFSCTTQEVYDGTQGLEGVPNVHVLPGRSETWPIACKQGKDAQFFQLEINPRQDGSRTAIFSGNIE